MVVGCVEWDHAYAGVWREDVGWWWGVWSGIMVTQVCGGRCEMVVGCVEWDHGYAGVWREVWDGGGVCGVGSCVWREDVGWWWKDIDDG